MDRSEFAGLWRKCEGDMESRSALVSDDDLAKGVRVILSDKEEWKGERSPFYILVGQDEDGKDVRIMGRAGLIGPLRDMGWTGAESGRWIGEIRLLGKSSKGVARYHVRGTLLDIDPSDQAPIPAEEHGDAWEPAPDRAVQVAGGKVIGLDEIKEADRAGDKPKKTKKGKTEEMF